MQSNQHGLIICGCGLVVWFDVGAAEGSLQLQIPHNYYITRYDLVCWKEGKQTMTTMIVGEAAVALLRHCPWI
jgi:hypothetical protein